MAARLALSLAIGVLTAHLLFIVWVIFGALVTRGRVGLTVLHLASLAYGVVIEVATWPCPLTLAENRLEARAGLVPYQGPFLLHYLDALVYPNVPAALLTWAAAVVCAVNLGVYLVRWRRSQRKGLLPPSGRAGSG